MIKALEIDPNFAEAWNHKGLTLDKLGKREDAEKHFNKARELEIL
jgi:Flp pilus assembly protein TadD